MVTGLIQRYKGGVAMAIPENSHKLKGEISDSLDVAKIKNLPRSIPLCLGYATLAKWHNKHEWREYSLIEKCRLNSSLAI